MAAPSNQSDDDLTSDPISSDDDNVVQAGPGPSLANAFAAISAPRVPAATMKVYQTTQAKALKRALGDPAAPEWHDLMRALLASDEQHGPSPELSRLLFRKEKAAHEIMMLLPQRTPQDLIRYMDGLKPSSDVRRPSAHMGPIDPVIYVNQTMDRDGRGIPIDEYGRFLTAMLLISSNDVPVADVNSLGVTKAGLIRRVDRAFYARQGAHGKRQLKAFLSTTNEADLKEKTAEFVEYQSRRWAVAQDDQRRGLATHIMLPSEVGLAANGYARTRDHFKMEAKKSPDLFRLMQLVPAALWPQDGWTLHQSYMFEMNEPIQAEIGESIASLIVGSYAALGGPNFTQAGIQRHGIAELNDDDWKDVIEAGTKRDAWRNTIVQAEDYGKRLEARIEEMNAEGRALERAVSHKETLEVNKQLESQLDAILQQADILRAERDAKLEQLQRQGEELERSLDERDAMLEALKFFAENLE